MCLRFRDYGAGWRVCGAGWRRESLEGSWAANRQWPGVEEGGRQGTE
jgi:hypothetical protein